MSRKPVLIIDFLLLFLIFTLICFSLVFPVSRLASASTVQYDDDFIIMADGSINLKYPTTPPVTTSDNITYTLTRNVTLNNWITVERNNTILDGANYTLTNAQPACPYGLELEGVRNVTVRNLNFIDSGGLWLPSTSDCVIIDNNFVNCTFTCFSLVDSTNVVLSHNAMENASFGDVRGDSINHFLHSIDTSNTVDGRPVYYLKNQKNLEINPSTFPDIGYLAVVNSSSIAVENLNLTNRRTGLLLAFTNNSRVTNNVMDNNVNGISAVSSSNNTVSNNELDNDEISLGFDISCCNNTITGNTAKGTNGIGLSNQSDDNIVSYNNVSGFGTGIWLFSFCSNNVLIKNHIENCSGEGIRLVQSQNNTLIDNTVVNTSRALRLEQPETCNNTFYHNNFENNTRSLLILGTIGSNIWDNGLEGNYWSDYNGTDNNQDGIGDTPYVIDANNTDHYPLMGTFQSFNVSNLNMSYDEISIVSNSTVKQVTFVLMSIEIPQPIFQIILAVNGQNGTIGFCRVTFQNDMLNSSVYPVNVAGNAVASRIIESNGTQTTLYFTFNQTLSSYQIYILPEFPSFLVLPLFIVAASLAIIVCKRKRLI